MKGSTWEYESEEYMTHWHALSARFDDWSSARAALLADGAPSSSLLAAWSDGDVMIFAGGPSLGATKLHRAARGGGGGGRMNIHERAVVGEITSIERLRPSVNGNPRYRFTIDGKNYFSSSDSMFVYEVGNPGYRVGCIVCCQLTKAGRIRYMEPSPTSKWR